MAVQPPPKKGQKSWQEYEDFSNIIEGVVIKSKPSSFKCIKCGNEDHHGEKIGAYCTICLVDNKIKGKLAYHDDYE